MTFEEWWERAGLPDGSMKKPPNSMREWFKEAYDEGYEEGQDDCFQRERGR